MVIKYYFSSFKKNLLSSIFPIIYMVPVFLLLSVNLIRNVGSIYQRYCFFDNSNFYCMNNSVEGQNAQFLRITTSLYGNYSEHLSLPQNPYYETQCTSDIYLCANAQYMKYSYFTEDNILDGHLPLEKYLPVGEQENDVYPINITYDVAIKMKSWTGDYINLKVVDGEKDEYINLYITGILKPDGMEDEKHLSVALLSHDAYEKVLCRTEFAKYASFYSSCDMQNCEETFLCEHLKDMKKDLLDELRNSVVPIMSIILIVFSICIVTHGVLKSKINEDMIVLNKMGLSKIKINTIHFMRGLSITFLAVFFSTVLIGIIYLPLIAKQYYDLAFMCIMMLSYLFLCFLINITILIAKK